MPGLRSDQFQGLQLPIRDIGGATAMRVIHPRNQNIEEHMHVWPCLTLPIIGSYTEVFEGEEARINGLGAVLHPKGGTHSNRIDEGGLETISIRFDPSWSRLAGARMRLNRTRWWTKGRVAAAARALSQAWVNPKVGDDDLAGATAEFISFALRADGDAQPLWLRRVERALHAEFPPKTSELAQSLRLHPAWLARAYRAATGEGMHDTLRRIRVARAVALLRDTDLALADIAAATEFCDQSHMNRSFRLLLGRTPVQVRAERDILDRWGDA